MTSTKSVTRTGSRPGPRVPGLVQSTHYKHTEGGGAGSQQRTILARVQALAPTIAGAVRQGSTMKEGGDNVGGTLYSKNNVAALMGYCSAGCLHLRVYQQSGMLFSKPRSWHLMSQPKDRHAELEQTERARPTSTRHSSLPQIQ